MTDGLTIGRAAAFVGVTVKTVRHYHRLGLVAEPARDGSGYRRYRSADLLRLVRARTLAAAGVPLAEVGELLDAGPERFAEALEDVDRRLAERIEELVGRRDTLRRLAGDGDRVLLPERAVAVLERLNELGFGPDYVAAQREALVLARASMPELFDAFLARLGRALDDPEHVELTKRGAEAASWDPDDPRVEELAAALAAKLLADRALLAMPAARSTSRSESASRYELIDHHGEERAPAVARLNALVEARLRAAGVDLPPSRSRS
ncbi:MerR family transcriptional regulator [Streptomyces sp. NPDC094032]|uniref:MerR family transcriptional regulator n=1 Tax=Streptomyces sp. NPDC094032 TaxID=3155308 RepID=UPI0033213639